MYEQKDVNYSIGDTVVHTIFGAGIIIEIQGGILRLCLKNLMVLNK